MRGPLTWGRKKKSRRRKKKRRGALIWSYLRRDEEEEEGEGVKELSMLGSDDVEGIGKGEVEEGGWGNHIIGEGEGGGREKKRRAWLRHALLAPSVKGGRPREIRLLMFELCFCQI
jgi:hypothetical protein